MSYQRVSRDKWDPTTQRYSSQGLLGDRSASPSTTSSSGIYTRPATRQEAQTIFAARAQTFLNEHQYGSSSVPRRSTQEYAAAPCRSNVTRPPARSATRSTGTSTSSSTYTAHQAPPPDGALASTAQYADSSSSSSSDDSSCEDYSSVRPMQRHTDSIGAVHGHRNATPPARPSSAASCGSGPHHTLLQKEAVGLENLGNTCFMNSVLQCLAVSPRLQEHLAQRDELQQTHESILADPFAELMQALHGADPGQIISPSRFVEQAGICNDRWGNGQQHDAQEFLRSLMDMLHAELNRSEGRAPFKALSGKGTESQQAEEAWRQARAQQSSVVSDLFEGQLQSTLVCTACDARSLAFEVFQDLSLPVPTAKRMPYPSIQDCLKAYSDEELLSGDDGHRCERCRCKQPTLKSLRICRCPPVLVLHLKRFSVNPSAFFLSLFDKDTTPVSLQEDQLDLSPFCTPAACKAYPRPVYDLYGVVCHSGSLTGGHYTAHVRRTNEGLFGPWITCNDSYTHVEMPRLKDSKAAYLMFYRQRSQ